MTERPDEPGRISMKIKFLRIIGVRAKDRDPVVLASVDSYMVRWKRNQGWTCTCLTERDECVHVDAVVDLLDDKVLGDEG